MEIFFQETTFVSPGLWDSAIEEFTGDLASPTPGSLFSGTVWLLFLLFYMEEMG